MYAKNDLSHSSQLTPKPLSMITYPEDMSLLSGDVRKTKCL